MVVQIRTVPMADTFVEKFVRLCLKVDSLGVVTVKDGDLFIVRSEKHLAIAKALQESGLTLYIKNIEVIEEERASHVYFLDETQSTNDRASEQESL